jgi:hypothetical protein
MSYTQNQDNVRATSGHSSLPGKLDDVRLRPWEPGLREKGKEKVDRPPLLRCKAEAPYLRKQISSVRALTGITLRSPKMEMAIGQAVVDPLAVEIPKELPQEEQDAWALIKRSLGHPLRRTEGVRNLKAQLTAAKSDPKRKQREEQSRKAAEAGLAEIQARQTRLDKLVDQPDKLERELDSIITAISDLQSGLRIAERELLEARKSEFAIIQGQLRELLGKIRADEHEAHPPLDVALAAKVRGIRFADLELDKFRDDKLDLEKTRENFAGGQVNKVSKLAYASGETRIFKPEGIVADDKAGRMCRALGIDMAAPRFGNRNIASSIMGDIIGTNVITKSCYAVHNGQVGLAMAQAPGVKAVDFQSELKFRKSRRASVPASSPEAVASLHQQLNSLEWTDMFTGQYDRHTGNYMIDIDPKTGYFKISGIDNDFAFGKNQGT